MTSSIRHMCRVGITSVLRRYDVGAAARWLAVCATALFTSFGAVHAKTLVSAEAATDLSARCISFLTNRKGYRAFKGAVLQGVYKNETSVRLHDASVSLTHADGDNWGCAAVCSLQVNNVTKVDCDDYVSSVVPILEDVGLERMPFPVDSPFSYLGDIETEIGRRALEVHVIYDPENEVLSIRSESQTKTPSCDEMRN
ncbi:hypothetical protein N9L47_11085 [Rhodobacteraceae bacterium]|nr:hypothetical protein [Paracoccaceae bacterium]